MIEKMMFSGNYGKAIESIDSMNSFNGHSRNRLNYNKLLSLYQLNNIDEAHGLLMQQDSATVLSYDSILAMVLAKKGKVKEAKEIMDKDTRVDYTLHGIEAAY